MTQNEITISYATEEVDGYSGLIESLSTALEAMKDKKAIKAVAKLVDKLETAIQSHRKENERMSSLAGIKRDIEYLKEKINELS